VFIYKSKSTKAYYSQWSIWPNTSHQKDKAYKGKRFLIRNYHFRGQQIPAYPHCSASLLLFFLFILVRYIHRRNQLTPIDIFLVIKLPLINRDMVAKSNLPYYALKFKIMLLDDKSFELEQSFSASSGVSAPSPGPGSAWWLSRPSLQHLRLNFPLDEWQPSPYLRPLNTPLWGNGSHHQIFHQLS